jgi:S-adenosylmethionine/arginine decarboxylase-like enzyme
MALIARRRSTAHKSRNTAPFWKMIIVLSATVAAAALMSALDSAHMSFLVVGVAALVVVAAVVWLMAKLLGVHLSVHSWDSGRPTG